MARNIKEDVEDEIQQIFAMYDSTLCLALQAYARILIRADKYGEWLNQPDNYFPWYSTRVVPSTANHIATRRFSPFREYYTPSGTPVVAG